MKMSYDIIDLIIFGVPYSLLSVILFYFGYKIMKPFNYIQHDVSPICHKNKKRDLTNIAMRLRKIGTKLPPPFPNGWFGIMESYELKPGEIMQVDCLGENFAVFRTTDGKSHVVDAYCPHLGASFANGGIVRDECIECPFHSWTFDAETGKCTSIPNLDSVPKGVNIKVWTSEENHGIIFVWYDKENRSPEWDIPKIDEIVKDEWIYHGRNEFFVATHVQDVAENASDLAHFGSVHSYNLLSEKFMPISNRWSIFGIHDWCCDWKISEKANMSIFHIIQYLKFFDKFNIFKVNAYGRLLGPGITYIEIKSVLGKFVIILYTTPIEPLLLKIVHRIYAPWYMRLIGKFILMVETIMINRDVCIWNQKLYVYNPQFAKTDKCLKMFRNWFAQFYSPNSTPFKEAILGPKKDLIDW